MCRCNLVISAISLLSFFGQLNSASNNKQNSVTSNLHETGIAMSFCIECIVINNTYNQISPPRLPY